MIPNISDTLSINQISNWLRLLEYKIETRANEISSLSALVGKLENLIKILLAGRSELRDKIFFLEDFILNRDTKDTKEAYRNFLVYFDLQTEKINSINSQLGIFARNVTEQVKLSIKDLIKKNHKLTISQSIFQKCV